MKVTLREEWKQSVNGREFVLAVSAVTLLLGGAGAYFLWTGRLPGDGPWFWIAGLVLVGAFCLRDAVRHGKPAFPLVRVTQIIGVVLLTVGQLMRSNAPFQPWAEYAGSVLIFGSLLAGLFRSSERSAEAAAGR